MQKNKWFKFLTLIILVSCGGGGGSSGSNPVATTPTPPPVPPPTPQSQIRGKVIFANESTQTSESYMQFFSKPSKYVDGKKVASLSNAKQDYEKYICFANIFNGISPSEVLNNIDINGDGEADTNISYQETEETYVVYKNVSPETFLWSEIPTQEQIQNAGFNSLEEMFEPKHFLFDMHRDLIPNIDVDGDEIPDKNISVNFQLQGVQVEPENLIFYNIESPNYEGLINEIVENPEDQPATISLKNHDIDYDGEPDINLDLNLDGIAETSIDEDGDCIGDFSVVDGEGLTVYGALVEIQEIIDNDQDGYYDEISDEITSTTTDANGEFVFEGLRTDKDYKLTITKQRPNKIAWSATLVIIDDDATLTWDIGTISLTSKPLLVGIEFNDIRGHIPGTPAWNKYGFRTNGYRFDFTEVDGWKLKLFYQDPNGVPLFIRVPYYDYGGNGAKAIQLITSDISESGYHELEIDFELRLTECYIPQYESSSVYWRNNYAFDDTHGGYFCGLGQGNGGFARGTYSSSNTIPVDYEQVPAWRYSVGVQREASSPSASSYITTLDILNTVYKVPTLNLQVDKVIINDQEFFTSAIEEDPFWINFEASDSQMSIQTFFEEGYEGTPYLVYRKTSCPFSSRSCEGIEGDNIQIDLSEDTLPQYSYLIEGFYSLQENCDSSQYLGSCNPYKRINIRVEPTYITEFASPPVLVDLFVNGIPFYEFVDSNIIYPGDAWRLTAQISDPRGLETKVKYGYSIALAVEPVWRDPSEEWGFSIADSYGYQSLYVCIQNNDGVGETWSAEGNQQTPVENDGCETFTFEVSE